MTKEFIPYEEALALKELGFDEPCLAFKSKLDDQLYFIDSTSYDWRNSTMNDDKIVLPLYQQAFRWFREKHGLDSHVYRPDEKLKIWGYNTTLHVNVSPFKTYEEAELACLKQLIKIVKEKK